MRPSRQTAYSYRNDAQVPAYDDDYVLLVMDGDCALCSASARRVAQWDRDDRVRITTAQSPLGAGLMRHYGIDPDDPQSWLLVMHGHGYGSLDGILRVLPVLHPAFKVFSVCRLLPLRLQDWLYARVALNRYAWFGRGDLCALPDPELRRRVLSE
ncbi:DCC1-like thiol-disulfide oxidoreductase family protein [uncultured Pelagimonas sp.]|uniref:thiol-disulfide oxidoreductase DCC family protein n=1 Tax=uncultured Pelagimonas sp. TaxID=1618102 RepID=UPI00262B27C7|nr:DCC1-like thiol-disulfide oxidoreductase family protein [uncultured Pelagimonas sp.]